MAMGDGEGSHGKPEAAVRPVEAAQDKVLPSRGPAGTDRVRRPADLLLAIFSFLIVAATLGSIGALPLGSTEVADDVSRGVRHIPSWLPHAAAAGLAGAATAIIASIVWRAGHGAIEHAVLHGSNPSIFVVDTAFVAFVVGTDLARRSRWKRWWAWSGAALLLSGLAVGTLTPFAVVLALFGGLLVGWVVRWLLGAASVLPTTAELTDWLTSQGVTAADLSVTGPQGRARLEGTVAD